MTIRYLSTSILLFFVFSMTNPLVVGQSDFQSYIGVKDGEEYTFVLEDFFRSQTSSSGTEKINEITIYGINLKQADEITFKIINATDQEIYEFSPTIRIDVIGPHGNLIDDEFLLNYVIQPGLVIPLTYKSKPVSSGIENTGYRKNCRLYFK